MLTNSFIQRFGLIGALALLAGCQGARVGEALPEQVIGNDPEAQMEFWHTVASRNLTSNDEAFHGLLLYLDGEDSAADYAGRVELLKSRKLLPKSFNRPAEEAVQRGTLAYAIFETLDTRGGLMLTVLRNHPRYATKELVFMNIFPPSSPHQTFSGSEFVGIIGRVEDYQRSSNNARSPSTAPAQ